jgi:polysaccharide biosynthesis protein PslG
MSRTYQGSRRARRKLGRLSWILIFLGLCLIAAGIIIPLSLRGSEGNPVGFAAPELLGKSPAVQVEQLQQMKDMGMTSVRLDANWFYGQPTGPGNYDWTLLDQAMASVRQVGLSADLIIDGCPPWAAAPGGQGLFAQPASPSAFASWANAVAARYGSQGARYFEIWNEPNIAQFWSPKPDPAAYTADLKAAYTAVKLADPSAVVLSGGLSPAGDTATSYDPRTFLSDMYADGAKNSFDGVADHPYSYPATPAGNPFSAWSQMSKTKPSLRSIMTAHGDVAKKIWITEYGAPTTGANSVSEAQQTAELVQAITAAKKVTWIASFYIYTWSNQSSLMSTDDGFGLLRPDGSKKPAYAAVSAALRASS